jgi:hypothetical protein
MKKHLCLVSGALVGILHVAAYAEAAKSASGAANPAASSAPHQTTGQSSTNIKEDCEDQWRADKEAMMKRDMTEDRYIEQCSVKDDVPAIPAPPATRNRSPDR